MVKFKNGLCKNLTFAECELAILRSAVDEAETKIGKRIVNSEEVQRIIDIVEDFLRRKKCICYGGTAINNLLPEQDRFYNKEIELPDYDFYSTNALHDAKELANLYYKRGFVEVEAKSGQHHGTYKVFVNFMAVADITQMPVPIYGALSRENVVLNGIHYAPPNFLRMAMYLELSRPVGDTTRWEKVLKRLTLLNKHYPVTKQSCANVEYQREMADPEQETVIYRVMQKSLADQGVVFFGGFAHMLYSQYMPKHMRHKLKEIADFDVLSNNPEETCRMVQERLADNGIHHLTIVKRDAIGELIPEHYELKIRHDSVLFVYKPIGCHSYNMYKYSGLKLKIATIDTMLSFYLAFLYANQPYYNSFLDRIMCMSKFLFEVQQKNRLAQKGLLKRFSIQCYGHQETIEEMKAHKTEVYKTLKEKINQPKYKKEFEEWFLNYRPETNKSIKRFSKSHTKKTNSNKSNKSRKSKSKSKKSNGIRLFDFLPRANVKKRKTKKH